LHARVVVVAQHVLSTRQEMSKNRRGRASTDESSHLTGQKGARAVHPPEPLRRIPGPTRPTWCGRCRSPNRPPASARAPRPPAPRA